jgi:ankyrin repeat protein
MQSLNINQLVVEGLAPLSYASQHVVHHILDMNILDEPSINDISQLSIQTLTSCLFKSDVSIPYDDFFQQSISSSSNNIAQTILTHSSFLNKNITILLRSALIYGTASFSRTLRDFKITHKKVFAQELNQYDKHQNTLLWYLTVGGLYSSIEELYRLASVELNINVKNGPFNQTILHYAVIHENMEKIRIILNIGTDTNLRDRFGRTALHYLALYGTKDNNNVEIGKLLMTHGILPKYEVKKF